MATADERPHKAVRARTASAQWPECNAWALHKAGCHGSSFADTAFGRQRTAHFAMHACIRERVGVVGVRMDMFMAYEEGVRAYAVYRSMWAINVCNRRTRGLGGGGCSG